MTAAVEVEKLAKRYGDVEAVRGIDFAVGAGEIFGFFGRQTRPLGRDGGGHLPKALLTHRLGKDCVGFAERIDSVD